MRWLPAALMIWSVSAQVFACAVCAGGNIESQWAYFGTTGLLTFVPLIAMGTIAGVLFLLARKRRLAQLKEKNV